jgi:serine/threonine protein kinase
VQEYMQGGTLKSLLLKEAYDRRPQWRYSRCDAFRWAVGISKAMLYLHRFKPMIVHRDLKAENVLLTRRNVARSEAKLADFGLHKMIKVGVGSAAGVCPAWGRLARPGWATPQLSVGREELFGKSPDTTRPSADCGSRDRGIVIPLPSSYRCRPAVVSPR